MAHSGHRGGGERVKTFHRTMDAGFLNTVVNDPTVRPWLGGEGELDLTAVIANPANYAFVTAGGGWLLVKHEAGVYELHSQFVKEARGRHVFEVGREAIRRFFAETDALEIVTKVPVKNRPASVGACLMGFAERFRRSNAWQCPDGGMCDVSYQALTIDAWVATDAELPAQGDRFHSALEATKARCGSPLPTHPDDEAHDRAAGAAALMMMGGNPRKAVWFYNRWARLAGYATIELVSESPPVLDVRDAIVGVRNGDLEVLLCR